MIRFRLWIQKKKQSHAIRIKAMQRFIIEKKKERRDGIEHNIEEKSNQTTYSSEQHEILSISEGMNRSTWCAIIIDIPFAIRLITSGYQ